MSSGCAHRNSIKDGTATAVNPVPTLSAPDPRNAIGVISSEYYIGPQDKLDVTVYQLPELTRSVQVDASGRIALPFVGVLRVSGLTVLEVRQQIAARLRVDLMQHPDVTVAVAEAVSQRITVEGAVTQPGVFPVSGRISLLQAIALARGTNNVANEKVVAIFRTINGERQAAVFNVGKIRDGQVADPAVYGNDTIVVERSRGKVLLRDVVGTLPLLGVFRTVNSVTN